MSKVLVITGGLVSGRDKSAWPLLRKQILQGRNAQKAWLESKIKLTYAETFAAVDRERKKLIKSKETNEGLRDFLSSRENVEPPSLTEISLCTLLRDHGVDFETLTLDDIFIGNAKTKKLLNEIGCIFLSSTYLRDLSELRTVLSLIKRPHNKIIVGGALMGTLHSQWDGLEEIDIVAIGYGEYLVPQIADWIKSGYVALTAPQRGRIDRKRKSLFLYSGVPEGLSLDILPEPDWKIAEQIYKQNFSMAFYESVRGCPYRCAFCNYPYLFDDTKFRSKSAERMATDWQRLVNESQVKYITCLDSLFTMPKKRIFEFCDLLIERKIKVKWICYARADDLCDEALVIKLIQAGCIQVQIGLESGDDTILKNMNKRVDAATCGVAIDNCRRHGLTTIVSMIVGFPGETLATLENTFQFLKAHPPDFHYVITFSTRATGVPVLSPESRERFGLVVDQNPYSISPYWKHATMDCSTASIHARELTHRLIQEKVSVDAALFYFGLIKYEPPMRQTLLDLQHRGLSRLGSLGWVFEKMNHYVDKKLSRDLLTL